VSRCGRPCRKGRITLFDGDYIQQSTSTVCPESQSWVFSSGRQLYNELRFTTAGGLQVVIALFNSGILFVIGIPLASAGLLIVWASVLSNSPYVIVRATTLTPSGARSPAAADRT
jgi:hypothetical protein